MSFLKELKWNMISSAVLFMVLGIVLVIFPGVAAKTICYAIAGILFVVGVVQVVSYGMRSTQQSYYRSSLFVGLTCMLVGGFVLYRVELIVSLVPFILGIMITVSGIMKLQNAFDLKRMRYGNWLVMLILSLINLAAGVVMVLNPFKTAELLFRLIGVSLIYSGITDFFSIFYVDRRFRRYERERERDIIDM